MIKFPLKDEVFQVMKIDNWKYNRRENLCCVLWRLNHKTFLQRDHYRQKMFPEKHE